MSNIPDDHPFFAASPGGERCKWCMFNRKAHKDIDPESPIEEAVLTAAFEGASLPVLLCNDASHTGSIIGQATADHMTSGRIRITIFLEQEATDTLKNLKALVTLLVYKDEG